MFTYLAVHKHEPRYDWVEIRAQIEGEETPVVIRQVVGEDPREMSAGYLDRIASRREAPLELTPTQRQALDDLFEEAVMARVMVRKETASGTDMIALFPTNLIHFRYPQKTTFRKSRSVRIQILLDEAYKLLHARAFEEALRYLDLVHALEPENAIAFELKVVCFRSWKKNEKCVGVFEEWIETHPDDPAPRLGLGEMWLYLEQFARARGRFEEMLALSANDPMALIGLAQAKAKLGEDPANELRKASMIDREYTVGMIEHCFDFKTRKPERLMPCSLDEIAKRYGVPRARVSARAEAGSLPAHPPEDEDGLLRFSPEDLDRYHHILEILGLEIGKKALEPSESEAVQRSLFDTGEV